MRLLFYAITLLLAGIFLLAAKQLLLLLGLTLLTTFLAHPFVKKLQNRGFQHHNATFIVYLSFLSAITLFCLSTYPLLKSQLIYLYDNRSTFEQTLLSRKQEFSLFLTQYFPISKVNNWESTAIIFLQEELSYLKSNSLESIGKIASNLSSLSFFPILAFLLTLDLRKIKQKIISQIPNPYFEMSLMMIHHIKQQTSGYLRGQIYDCFWVGVLASIGLSVLGVKGAIVIGFFAGIANAVPYLGPIIGAAPAVFVLLLDQNSSSPWWSVLVLFAILNLVDNFIIYPMTVGKSLNLPPFVVILGILLGGSLAGIWGMILAVPLIGITSKSYTVMYKTLKFYQKL